MPIARFQMPDGRVARFEVPDGTTPEQAQAMMQQFMAAPQKRDPGEYDPKSPEWQAKYGPTAGMSGAEKFAAGAGKAVSDLALGARQLFGGATKDDVKEARRLDAPLMASGAGTAGNIAGNVAALLPASFIPGVNTVAGAGTLGAVTGLFQPSESMGEAVGNVALGGLFGAGGQKAANMIGTAAQTARQGGNLTQGQQQAAQAGQKLGMELTPGKAAGSATLQKIEAALEANPMTSRGFDAIKRKNQTILNRQAAAAIGEQADEVSAGVLGNAYTRIGKVFDSVADKTGVPLDPMAVGAKLRQIEADSAGMLANNAELAANGLWKRLDDFVNNQGGATREQLRKLSSDLGKKARNEMTTPMGDRALGDALMSAQEVVEDAIQGTLSKQQQALYQQAREQYRNLMLLMTREGAVNKSSGDVAAKSLANVLGRKDRAGYAFGQRSNDLYDAVRFNQAFPDIVGNSGTATRSLGPTDYVLSLPSALATRAYLSAPVRAAAQLGAGGVGTGARLLDNQLTRMLSAPGGVASGLTLADLLQQ